MISNSNIRIIKLLNFKKALGAERVTYSHSFNRGNTSSNNFQVQGNGENMIKNWYIKFINSKLWFHVYYKHTKKHRAELKEIVDRINKTKNKLTIKH